MDLTNRGFVNLTFKARLNSGLFAFWHFLSTKNCSFRLQSLCCSETSLNIIMEKTRHYSVVPLIRLSVTIFVLSRALAFEGDLTFYFPEQGITACGTHHSSSEFIAALSFADFVNTPNPNNSPSCLKCALIRNSAGRSALVRIRDKCAGCRSGDIDVTTAVFQIFAPLSVGRTRVSWDFMDCSGSPSRPTSPPSSGTGNYCGTSYVDSKACRSACPGGVDRECPFGQRCFASVPC